MKIMMIAMMVTTIAITSIATTILTTTAMMSAVLGANVAVEAVEAETRTVTTRTTIPMMATAATIAMGVMPDNRTRMKMINHESAAAGVAVAAVEEVGVPIATTRMALR